MKKGICSLAILLAALLAALLGACGEQGESSQSVASLLVSEPSESNEETSSEGTSSEGSSYIDEDGNLVELDERGEIVRKTAYDGAGDPHWVEEYADGRLVRSLTYAFGELFTVREYDGEETLAKETCYYEDGTYGVTTFTGNGEQAQSVLYDAGTDAVLYIQDFDENGVIRKLVAYDENGLLESAGEFDETGATVKWINYEGGEVASYYAGFEWDERGNCLRQNTYDPEGNLLSYDLSEYDEYGNLLLQTNTYDADGVLREVRVIEEYDADFPLREVCYRYDRDGKLVYESHSYYDEDWNWVVNESEVENEIDRG